MALNSTEFKLNLIMKTDEIAKCWNLIKLLIDDDFIINHPGYSFEAFDAIDSNIDDLVAEMETCAVGDQKYNDAKKELKTIRETIESLTGDQIEMISVTNDEVMTEKDKAQKALEAAFDNMRSRGAKIEQIFPQGE